MELANNIHSIFVRHGYQWTINGTLTTPSVEDIKDLLDKLGAIMDDDPTATTIETGRLLVRTNNEHRDVYVHVGDYNEENN